jgi:uncharacterized protein (TIGR02996 family)
MDDEQALLAAIKAAHPDEDTPRLVYADWLDEHDRGGHAAATRLAVELRRTTPTDGDTPTQTWCSRHAELMTDVANNVMEWFGNDLLEWLAGPAELNTKYKREAGFDRGMLVLKGAPFQLNDEHARRLKPYVTKLVVTGLQGGPGHLKHAIHDLGVKELSFFSGRHSSMTVMRQFMVDPERSSADLVYVDFGGSVTNYMLVDLCGWTEYDAASLKEIRVGPGRIGTELSKWDDPHARADLIESSLHQYGSRGNIRPRTRAVIKKVRYCPHTYWRF